jgi:hypothetical protein
MQTSLFAYPATIPIPHFLWLYEYKYKNILGILENRFGGCKDKMIVIACYG